MKYEHSVSVENALKFFDWIQNRGGVAIWSSVNLSNPSASWSTPAMDMCPEAINQTEGIGIGNCPTCKGVGFVPAKKPTWEASNTPTIVKDMSKIEVYKGVEVKRFRVGVRRGSQGLSLKVTDGGSRKIWAEVEKAGEGAYYQFDYDTQEAVIFKTESLGSLKDWIKKESEGPSQGQIREDCQHNEQMQSSNSDYAWECGVCGYALACDKHD